ncbi:MAG TPA: hypothetical protein VGP07_26125 [Polyangia bacterium]|jgi:hypothetical protein
MTIDEILRAVMKLEDEIVGSKPGAPELQGTIARLQQLEGELERTRGLQPPLIPDASRPPTADEQSGAGLERTLHSLLAAARSKQAV